MEQRPEFTFRKITPEDKASVTALCAKIWDGDDYLPKRFDSWVAEKTGSFNACLYEGKLIGLGKLSFLSPGHAWLEGLRKDPDVKVRGVGKALCRHALGQLRAMQGLKSIRFSTYALNVESISLNESLGFVRVETHSVKSKKMPGPDTGSATADSLNTGMYTPRKIADPKVSIALMREQGWFKNFVCFSWKAYPASDSALVERLMAKGLHFEVLDAAGKTHGSIWYNDDAEERHIKIVGMQADSTVAARALFAVAEEACLRAGYDYIEAMVPPRKTPMEFFAAAGYESWEREDDFCIYELPLNLLKNF